MIVKVLPHIEIPHEVTVHGKAVKFNPTAELSPEIGMGFIKTRPNIYAEVKEAETVDLKDYTVKDLQKNKTFQEKFNSLSGENKLKATAFVDSLLNPVKDEVKSTEENIDVPVRKSKKKD